MERNKTMKNKYTAFVALTAAALATSCASDDLAEQKQNQGETQTMTLTASVADDNTTRVGMTKDNNMAKFYWHKGDKISVLTVNGSSYGNAEFTTTADNGTTSAEFTGEVTGKVGAYALYPYSENHKFDENGTTYNLPASYTYDKVESKIFGTDADYLANSTNMPMLGTIASGNITFKHLGGLAVIRIDKMPAESGTLTVTADQQLSGNFTVSDLTDTPTIATTATNTETAKKVTFTFSNATANGVGVFYLPLATGDYTNVEIVLNSGTVNQTMNWSELTVSRASVTAIPVVVNTLINGHTFVDLGLTSGLLWATTNVGATSPSETGNLYAWGEIETKDKYEWDNYKHADAQSSIYGGGTPDVTIKKYLCNGTTTLDSDDDAAYQNWGESCRMPTISDYDELINGCNVSSSSMDGITGVKVVSKKNGNSIFLPFVNSEYIGWSSSLHTSLSKYAYTGRYDVRQVAIERYNGLPVRPVAKKQ